MTTRSIDEPAAVAVGLAVVFAAALVALAERYELAVVTNDIYTTEDADFLRRHAS